MAKSTYEYIISHEPDGSSNKENQIIKQAIHKIKKQHPAYGYRRVTGELHKMNFLVNHKRVLALMRDMKLSRLLLTNSLVSIIHTRELLPKT